MMTAHRPFPIAVMTAILVVAILGIFEPQIKSALSGIIDSVSGNK